MSTHSSILLALLGITLDLSQMAEKGFQLGRARLPINGSSVLRRPRQNICRSLNVVYDRQFKFVQSNKQLQRHALHRLKPNENPDGDEFQEDVRTRQQGTTTELEVLARGSSPEPWPAQSLRTWLHSVGEALSPRNTTERVLDRMQISWTVYCGIMHVSGVQGLQAGQALGRGLPLSMMHPQLAQPGSHSEAQEHETCTWRHIQTNSIEKAVHHQIQNPFNAEREPI